MFLLALVTTILAMLTKEISFTLPVMLMLYELFFFKASVRKRFIILLPVLLTIVIIPLTMINTKVPIGRLLSDMDAKLYAAADISRLDYLFTQFCVITTYIRLLFLPVSQNLDYAYPVYHSLFAPRVLLSFLFLTGLLATATLLFIKSKRGSEPALRLAAFGIFWFFIALAVESSLIPIADVIFEHRMYLPSVGACMAIATVLTMVNQHHQQALVAAVVVLVTVLSFTTWKRNQVWGDELTLWQDTVSKSPQKDRPHINLAEALKRKGRVDEAVVETETALKINPNYAEAHSNLGAAYLDRGDKNKALEHLLKAVKLTPNLFSAHYNLGMIYYQKGDLDQAAEQFANALQLNPDYADAHNYLAVTYASKEMLEPAIEHFREAVRLKNGNIEYRKNLEMALQMTHNNSKALR
jgi:tetratricopeptide (TPR) repeat protein